MSDDGVLAAGAKYDPMPRRIMLAVVASALVMSSLVVSAGALADGDVGALDPLFNAAGEQPGIVDGLPAGQAINWAVATQPDGKIVVAAAVFASLPESPFETSMLVVMRLNTDGTLDQTLNAGGPSPGTTEVSFGAGTTAAPDVIHVDSDGRIVVLGAGRDGAGNYAWAVARLNSDGTPDASFDPSGSVPGTEMLDNGTSDPTTQLVSVGEGSVTTDSKILLEGATETNGAGLLLERLNADGSIDATFNPGGNSPGKAVVPVTSIASADAVAVQSDGTIDAALETSGSRAVIDRVAADGSSVLWSASPAYGGNQPLQVLPVADGVVEVVRGTRVARFTADGSLDTSFGSGGHTLAVPLAPGQSGNPSPYFPAALAPDGSIVVAGTGDVGGRLPEFWVMRFTPNGELDTTFDPGGTVPGEAYTPIGANAEAYGVVVQADAKIVAVGTAPSGGAVVRYLATHVAPPTVTKLKPREGPTTGGTTVTISGTNLNGATMVRFGSTDASSFTVKTVKSVTSITAVSPPEAEGTVDVTVTTVGGTSAPSTKDRFKFTPTVTGVSPNNGSKAGGTSVTVTGTGFALGTTATIFRFGPTKAPSVNCTSTTTCTVVSPTHEVGTVYVKATVSKVSSPKNGPASQFTYE